MTYIGKAQRTGTVPYWDGSKWASKPLSASGNVSSESPALVLTLPAAGVTDDTYKYDIHIEVEGDFYEAVARLINTAGAAALVTPVDVAKDFDDPLLSVGYSVASNQLSVSLTNDSTLKAATIEAFPASNAFANR